MGDKLGERVGEVVGVVGEEDGLSSLKIYKVLETTSEAKYIIPQGIHPLPQSRAQTGRQSWARRRS